MKQSKEHAFKLDSVIESHDTETKLVSLKRPKYKEQYSLEECAKFQPWKVTLKVELDDNDPEPVDYDIFCRAASPDEAQFLCYTMFNYWTHIRPKNLSAFPRVSTQVHSEAEKLSESQWSEFWKEAQTYPHVKLGMSENPSVFRFKKPDWDKRSGIINPNGSSIIVPDITSFKK